MGVQPELHDTKAEANDKVWKRKMQPSWRSKTAQYGGLTSTFLLGTLAGMWPVENLCCHWKTRDRTSEQKIKKIYQETGNGSSTKSSIFSPLVNWIRSSSHNLYKWHKFRRFKMIKRSENWGLYIHLAKTVFCCVNNSNIFYNFNRGMENTKKVNHKLPLKCTFVVSAPVPEKRMMWPWIVHGLGDAYKVCWGGGDTPRNGTFSELVLSRV